jgi:putative holliday junction resolvase
MSDPEGILASPLTIIDRQDETTDIQAIADLIRVHRASPVVVGLPRSMDGSLSRQAEKVKAFTEALAQHIDVPLKFRDERLSTVSAQRLMREVKKPRQTRDDAIAAAIVLQGFLDESR